MRFRSMSSRLAAIAVVILVPGAMLSASPPARAAAPSPARAAATSVSPTLTVSTNLANRRYVASGDRAYELGSEDGRYPAMGFHTRGEMGGIWTPPIKLLDGIWFGINGQWIGPATSFTSGFGYRWGVLHAGIDLANSIGTPIRAVSDGVVIDAGPTAGYGMWVKLRHADGTVTLYGHVNTTLVSVGQRVMAGDQIATMGNRGNSTGPHLHFEVLLGGSQRVDPVPWLARRGLSVGTFAG